MNSTKSVWPQREGVGQEEEDEEKEKEKEGWPDSTVQSLVNVVPRIPRAGSIH